MAPKDNFLAYFAKRKTSGESSNKSSRVKALKEAARKRLAPRDKK